jgi:nickel-dependent lactate racemase
MFGCGGGSHCHPFASNISSLNPIANRPPPVSAISASCRPSYNKGDDVGGLAPEPVMRVTVDYGRSRIELEADASRVVGGARPADPDLADPAAAVRAALEAPFEYPPLRRALTPDDTVTVIVDEQLPGLAQLLIPVLEHLASAGVTAESVTLLVPPSTGGQPWINDLPDEFQEARVEVHDPTDRKRLRYLATTRGGRRLYLSKRVVDADQLVVLSGRRFDPVFGISGAEGAIFPAFSDAETRSTVGSHGRLGAPNDSAWPAAKEAVETAWLLGAPFFVQIIEGGGDRVAEVIAGSVEASARGRHRLEARWTQRIAAAADVVVASVSGDPARQNFADLAAASACATRVVRPGGRVVLLSEISAAPAAEFDVLRGADDPGEVASRLGPAPVADQIAVARWAEAASHARLTVLSGLDADLVEDLSATPLESASQVQRLLDASSSYVFLHDAHKAVASIAE